MECWPRDFRQVGRNRPTVRAGLTDATASGTFAANIEAFFADAGKRIVPAPRKGIRQVIAPVTA
jgi:hypothetical protein